MPFESNASRHESMTLFKVAYLLLVNGLLAVSYTHLTLPTIA